MLDGIKDCCGELRFNSFRGLGVRVNHASELFHAKCKKVRVFNLRFPLAIGRELLLGA